MQGVQTLQGAITNGGDMPPFQNKEWATQSSFACAWSIWLARNRKVFDNATLPTSRIEENCLDTITLWANRCKQAERQAIKNWAEAMFS
jgi:hypothetical protein